MHQFHPWILTGSMDPLGRWPMTIWFLLTLTIIFLIFFGEQTSQIRWSIKSTWSFFLIYSLFYVEFPYPFYSVFSRPFQASAGQTFIEVLLYPLMVLKIRKWILKLIPWLCLIECVLVLSHIYGLMIAPSFDTAFIALCVPFIPIWMIPICLITIVSHHGSTALSILASEMIGYTIVRRRAIQWTAPAIAIGALYAYLHPGTLLGMESRIVRWRAYMEVWSEHWTSVLFGFGPGSFLWMSLSIDKMQPPLFLCMHCDWLQILFTTGIVGLSLIVWLSIDAFVESLNRPKVLAALLGAWAFGITYHPLEFGPTAVLVSLIYSICLVEQEVDLEIPSRSLATI